MAKVLLLNDGGYPRTRNDFSKVAFPAEVEASIDGHLVEVAPTELARIGVRGYIASDFPICGNGWSFVIGSEATVLGE